MKNKKYPKWFYAVLLIIPVLFLGLLEVTLFITDYGKNLDQWIINDENRIVLNPDISARYFTNITNYPYPNNDSFSLNKSENTIRIFVLGGSTAAGFPYSPNGTFPRFLKDYLEMHSPKVNFEVINLGITAVNSYTVMDLIPGVLEKSPDLILIYAGHNEYYGALGVGSTQNFGNSRSLIHLYLKLNKFRTFQLVKNFTGWIIKLFSQESEFKGKSTLMAGMASEKSIPINSALYNEGLEQFESNLKSILELTNEENVPVIFGTLTSNIRDQKPFISTKYNHLSANSLYKQGLYKLLNKEIIEADSLLTMAADLDGLRFRAPSKINLIIKNLAKKYKCTLVDIEKEFKNLSPDNIVGNNLMIDHLHPTLEGYQFMGKFFFESLIKNDLLPISDEGADNKIIQDSVISKNFAYSTLDKLIAQYRIDNLLNDWPFNSGGKKYFPKKPSDHISQLAYQVIYKNLNWRKAHQEAYRWYLSQNDFNNFAKEIKVILSQYPYKLEYYNYAAEKLLEKREYRSAWEFLIKRDKLETDGFTTKWIGNILLMNKNYDAAINYFKKSLTFDSKDIQTLYNTGLAYYRISDIASAKKYMNTCLIVQPNYKPATELLKRIK